MAKSSNSTQRKFSSEASANYPCQACGKIKPSATIYLTFDDGIEPGTEEVYKVLKSENVPGTFFCVGENVLNRDNSGLFKKIYDDPNMLIGNHSMTHGHQFYDSYYGENSNYWRSDDKKNAKYRKEDPKGYYLGVRINKKSGNPDAKSKNKQVARRSYLMDFEYANAAFTAKLLSTSYKNPDAYAPNYLGKLELVKLNYSRFLIARMPGTNH